MIRLTQNDWRIFRRLQRKHKVSTEFLRYNLENIEKFIWFETWPRIVIRRYAVRKENRVFITYYRLRRVLFDQSNRKMFKRMRQNIRQWSKRVVAWQKINFGIKEYIEEIVYEGKSKEEQGIVGGNSETACSNIEDVSRQLKEQLELLKYGRRPQSLITSPDSEGKKLSEEPPSHKEKEKSDKNVVDDVRKGQEQYNYVDSNNTRNFIAADKELVECSSIDTHFNWQTNLESTPEKQITNQENIQPVKQLDTDEKTEKSHTEPSTHQTEKLKAGSNFLDMLMCKVSGSTANSNCIGNINTYSTKKSPFTEKESLSRISSTGSFKECFQHHHEHSMDSTDEFLGFDDCERIPGMLMTPIVPHSIKNSKNSVFVSESLNEYMRLNDLETNYSIDEDKSVTRGKIFARNMEGLMTPKTKPPHFDMPAVPENLLKFRTVAERKQYLQKFSKNYRLAIINNEAIIYRELQRRMRLQKVKSASQTLAQSPNSSMSFTRNGWNAASFINTEFNKYYYQILDIDHGTFKVRLRGARGNNDDFNKTPYVSRVMKSPPNDCFEYCTDDKVWQYLKPIKTIAEKTKKLNRESLPSVFKPCPLSHKTFQKPLDDDTAALLLAGGSMAVVRMPTVELEVFPEYGRPLHEIAKRYLQYILPHHDISREWAEFSVSTLQQPKTLKEAEQAAAKSFKSRDFRKSYTFVIPYLNDRNHILVRRVVDRSEKLDESFEQCVEEKELVPKTDFSFRKNLNLTDDVLLTCADVVSDMINTVAISCSENSFIKIDPDSLNAEEILKIKMTDNCKQDLSGNDTSVCSPNVAIASGGVVKKHKKQNSLLMELKRLNATIIDAAVKTENDKKPCSKDYCQMGCICVSLQEIVPIREHCGKTKCMLECTCKLSNQSRIMRLETDGRTLTTEDAFMLRRKATARLARMEKEFTSTVVLTENETLLINETNNDKKRRCTKAPKRYEDFTDTEDEARKHSPKKTALTTIDREKHLAVEIKEVHDPVYVKDSILEQLKHCTVNLVPLRDMDNIAPWCMVHNLYKCFCKGRAVEGKPMIIEKEGNCTPEHDAEQKSDSDFNVSVKAKYSFDKVELKKNYTNDDNNEQNEESCDDNVTENFEYEDEDEDEDDDDDDWIREGKRKHRDTKVSRAEKQLEQHKISENSEKSEEEDCAKDFPIKAYHTEKQKSKRSLHDVRKRFYTLRPDSCRRHIPTPRRMFLYCNRRRRINVLKYIKDNENDRTRLLLNEHVMRSVYYHKIDVESHKNTSLNNSKEKSDCIEKPSKIYQSKQPSESLPLTDGTEKKFLLVNEIVDLLDDEDDASISSIPNKSEADNSKMPSSSTKSYKPFEKLLPDAEIAQSTNHFQICSSGGIITVKKFPTATGTVVFDQSKLSTTGVMEAAEGREIEGEAGKLNTGIDELKLPKIASCFSLNVKANIQKPATTATLNEEQCLDFTSATSVHSAAFSQNQNQQTKKPPSPVSAGTVEPPKDASSLAVLDMDNENVRDLYNSVIKTMNSLVSKKMQDIHFALQRESHIIPAPNADILCIMKWCNFLDAFCEGFAYIWQVKMKDSSFLAITIKNVMPLIIGAMGIVNIAALKAEKMALMGRMLLLKFRNKETEKLAVVMQGKQSYWVVKGFLKSDPTTACNKPTPGSHPSLTKKINVLCSLLVKQRQKEQKRKEKLANQWTSPQVKPTTNTMCMPTKTSPQQTPLAPKIAQIIPTRRMLTVQPRTATQIQNSRPITPLQEPTAQPLTTQGCQESDTDAVQKLTQNESDSGSNVISKTNTRKRKSDNMQSINFLTMDNYSKMSSNIEFRSVTQSDIDEIFLPEIHKLDHKWLVLDLHNDFSHIFVPDFRDLVSLDRIQKVINFARQKSKIVKLQFFQNAPFDAFVTPKSIRKIYFGPLTTDMKGPTLILLQSVDGQMMVRELYQLQHNIAKKPEERTKAFWLKHIKGQTQFEMDMSMVNGKTTIENVLPSTNTHLSNVPISITAIGSAVTKIISEDPEKIANNNEDDDEDCMIIDDTMQNSITKDTTVNILPHTNSLPIQKLLTTKANIVNSPAPTIHTQSLLKVPNTNTIIKPISSLNMSGPVVINVPSLAPSNKPLPFLTLPPNTIITGINTSTPTNVTGSQVVSVPKNAIITGIESAPPEASYSSTIFISSTPSSTVKSTAKTTISSATINSTTKTTHSSELNRTQENEIKSTSVKQSTNIIRQALEAGAIKRRRISLFCSNKYDKISENLAVDAVIRKILPDNAQDIQISDERNALLNKAEAVTKVGSTQISKITSNPEPKILPIALGSAINKEKIKPKAPIVFDVNFMDDGDEPTASIVIKPSSSTATSSLTTSTTQSCKNVATRTTAANNTMIKATPSTYTKNVVAIAPKLPTAFNTTTVISSTNSRNEEPSQKKGKLSTTSNITTTAITTATSTTFSGNTKLLNSLLCTKQANIVPQFSTPKPIVSKLTNTSNLSSPPINTALTAVTAFPFRRGSISLKVIGSSSAATTLQAVKPINTSETVTTNQRLSASTLTVKQVQDMLNQPNINVALNSTISSPVASPLPSMPLQLLPKIKATITPAKVTEIAATSPIITPTATTTASSGSVVSSTLTVVKPLPTAAPKITSLNPTLTISKVQSFGSPQKSHNVEKNLQAVVSAPGQVVGNDINDKPSTPTPPAHIQYGYIVSEANAIQKFVAKRVADEFYVKVPTVGILKLQGVAAVNNYLNKYVGKMFKETQTTPAVWQFIAASKAVQMQNHQKSLLVRKTKNSSGNTGTAKNIANNINSLEEPILIED